MTASNGSSEPALAAESHGFNRIQSNIECPFARRARHWAAPQWRPDSTLEQNLECIANDLDAFVAERAGESWDGYLIEIRVPGAGETLQSAADWLRVLICGLWRFSPESAIDLSAVEDRGFWFGFRGVRFFVLVFAPCYGSRSSRYSFGADSLFVLLQPELSFERMLRLSQRALGELCTHIRSEFAKNGREYDVGITLSPYEAHRYLKPLRLGDPIVRWWKSAPSAALAATPERHGGFAVEPSDVCCYHL